MLQPFPLAPRKSLGLFLENGDQWKRSRTSLTPAFSSGKLRQMFPQINDCVDHLMCNTEEKCDEEKPFDMYKYVFLLLYCYISIITTHVNNDLMFVYWKRPIFILSNKTNLLCFFPIQSLPATDPGRNWQVCLRPSDSRTDGRTGRLPSQHPHPLWRPLQNYHPAACQ